MSPPSNAARSSEASNGAAPAAAFFAFHPARTPTYRRNPVFTPEYRCLIEVLIEARQGCGLSQRALARGLGRSQSHVCKIEQGERRVDVLEFYRIAQVCGLDPAELYARAARRLAALEPASSRS